MNDSTLQGFRDIAVAMGIRDERWQWTGRHMSQRMFGISEARAKEYATIYGGTARRMDEGGRVDRKPGPDDSGRDRVQKQEERGKMIDFAKQNIAALKRELVEAKKMEHDAWEMVDAATERASWPPCACIMDHVGDVCGVHSSATAKRDAEIAALKAERAHLVDFVPPEAYRAVWDAVEAQKAENAALRTDVDWHRSGRDECRKDRQRLEAEIATLTAALTEIRDRLADHPAYADLSEAEEEEAGGDMAELSYLVRVANNALAAWRADPLLKAAAACDCNLLEIQSPVPCNEFRTNPANPDFCIICTHVEECH